MGRHIRVRTENIGLLHSVVLTRPQCVKPLFDYSTQDVSQSLQMLEAATSQPRYLNMDRAKLSGLPFF